ncbi:hypothetical protein HJP15_21545 [Pseudoalteromonas sp. NEC-BIFX-2020_002]|uniref:Orphan protein n=1 Tax=Pseudoalteromonas translucida (strain TAC 125) TaxID=326442 RepID=Q3IGR2_PSET1|nr:MULTISPECIES: hypothetical protein [Pseudoalteromonas]NNG45463.1 hypothetical protein [Pseudoalteromonas sp. NEC-BIFX-2020_002]CAI86671.1 putative orphan protein [Pseudoalteromonas translucida]
MKVKDKNKVLQAANFIEELAWLLNSKKKIDLENVSELLRHQVEPNQSVVSETKQANKLSHYIGVLPFLLQDKELFRTNKDIIEFAENLFSIQMTRNDRRSRYELVGFIVTEIIKVDEEKLLSIMNSLSVLTESDDKLVQFRKTRNDIDFSWNEAISKLNKS